jgi:hypothetical protein
MCMSEALVVKASGASDCGCANGTAAANTALAAVNPPRDGPPKASPLGGLYPSANLSAGPGFEQFLAKTCGKT